MGKLSVNTGGAPIKVDKMQFDRVLIGAKDGSENPYEQYNKMKKEIKADMNKHLVQKRLDKNNPTAATAC